VAQRLTTAPAEESHAAISPDGRTIAFSASYEGPTEVYTMPVDGGAPTRRTFDGSAATVVGWTPDGKVMYTTRKYSTLPNTEMAVVDPRTNSMHLVPLAQASDGVFTPSGTLVFTRFAFQGSQTKRYKGGTAQNIWKFARNATEAAPLTADWKGTSRSPMLWQDRIYFNSDRDGTMNLWSMDENGKNLKQLTHHADFDVQSPSLSNGRIAYQLGADLHVFDIAAGSDRVVPIELVSDFDQTRERWVTNPSQWITGVRLSPTGDRVALTARGQVFVVPTDEGRLVDATATQPARWRDAQFMPDGKSVLATSDKSGEMEFWTMSANGIGDPREVTRGGTVLRWAGVPSPDGRWLANTDKNQKLWLTEIATGATRLLGTNGLGNFGDLSWSADSRWLAYDAPAANEFGQIYLYGVESGVSTPVTSDRYDSYNPTWSADGKWLYFLSDRHLKSLVTSTWGARQPEPYFYKQADIFALALAPGERNPFEPADELHADARVKADSAKLDSGAAMGVRQAGSPRVTIVLDGIERRLVQIPVAPDNYYNLSTDGKRLYVMTRDASGDEKTQLKTLTIGHEKPEFVTFTTDLTDYELSANRKKLLVQKRAGAGRAIYVLDAGAKAPTDLNKAQVNLKGWVLHFDPRAEWHEEFDDAWRLERDYFYDRGMNGVDWPAMRKHYEPLVDRVTDRAELSDIFAQMVGELSALHIFVRGGDMRRGTDAVLPASLGARLERDEAHGGYRVDHIYQTDPDEPESLSPLARYGVDVHDGDVITAVNGVPTAAVPDIGSLLRDQADKQVLLRVRPANGAEREVVVTPISQQADGQLRYSEWEYTRRLAVDSQARGALGYVHLRAMSSNDINQWARDFYPAFNRQGLILDVRHNNGGNIDSWILEKLMRKAWFYFQSRVGDPTWNMQYAFRGPIVVLTDESTASDGEAFSEGFRRLGLGKIIGTRTWGGEIWLSQSNTLVDRGIATAAETGVYGPEGKWLIEGHGVDPDIVVDNLPHATFAGKDAQLEAAIAYLQQEIKAHPNPVPPHPAYPDKSLHAVTQAGSTRKP
jgi:tricorn protease